MIKVQINLYEHREKDYEIIRKLGLDTSANPNALIRDVLYKLTLGIEIETKTIQTSNNIKTVKTEKPTTVDNRLISGMSNLL